MQQAVLELYPDAIVQYRFKNRGSHKFGERFLELFKSGLENVKNLKGTEEEYKKFETLSFIKPWYAAYVKSFRFDPSQITFDMKDGGLSLQIDGPWHSTILWEVPLMALISECYFQIEKKDGLWDMKNQASKLELKGNRLSTGHCRYADFGTRRRRCYEVQDFIVNKMKDHYWFSGTSNVHLAFKHGVRPIGTMAHEWVQATAALESMNHPNRFMLENWVKVYGSDLGIALPDTYGAESFFKDFNKTLASIYDGVRHDSGDPFIFADKVVQHYKEIGIDHTSKTIVFSDGLNADLAAEIQTYCDNIEIKCSFGIGTSFTNDFDTPALNMVIKLWSVNGMCVVKLSDNPGKANGDEAMVKIMRHIHMPEACIMEEVDAKTAPKSFGYKLRNNLLTLEDQKEALTDPYWAYIFAKHIPGADIEACQKAVIKDPEWAYEFAKDIPGANIEACQGGAVKNPYWAYIFAKDVPGANIEFCQEAAVNESEWAYHFARDVKGADIEVCQEGAVKDPEWAYKFARDVKRADIEVCQGGVIKDPEWAYQFAKDIPEQTLKLVRKQ